jgi:hypothetical protein
MIRRKLLQVNGVNLPTTSARRSALSMLVTKRNFANKGMKCNMEAKDKIRCKLMINKEIPLLLTHFANLYL